MNSDTNNFNKNVHKGESAEADLTEATPPNPLPVLRTIDTPSVHPSHLLHWEGTPFRERDTLHLPCEAVRSDCIP